MKTWIWKCVTPSGTLVRTATGHLLTTTEGTVAVSDDEAAAWLAAQTEKENNDGIKTSGAAPQHTRRNS